MSEENKEILIKRAKSFVWRLGGIVGVAVLGFVGDNLSLFSFHPQVVIVLGLLVGELTKYLNSGVKEVKE